MLCRVKRDAYLATPLVAVEREEIDGVGWVSATSQVVLQHRPKLSNVGSTISNRHLAIVSGGPVCLQVSRSGLDVGSSHTLAGLGDDLVAHEKAEGVIILDKLVHNRRE